jgi:hypothetical protein
MEWVQEFVLRDPMNAWLIPLTASAAAVDVEDDMSRKIVIVSEAGVPEITGQYIFVKKFNDACLFEKAPTIFQGKFVTFSMYRCKLQNKKSAWFISYRDDNGNPGDNGDYDFYSAPALYIEGDMSTNDVLPPSNTWEVLIDRAIGPAPQITIIDGEIGDVDSDRSMGVVMDDESSSQNDPDLPVLGPNDDSLVDLDDSYQSYSAI